MRGNAPSVVGERRVVRQLAQVEVGAELPPLRIAHHGDEELLAVRAVEQVVDAPGGAAHRHRFRRRALGDVLSHVLADQEGGGFEQRAGDVLAAPGRPPRIQRRKDGDDAEHAAGDVHHR